MFKTGADVPENVAAFVEALNFNLIDLADLNSTEQVIVKIILAVLEAENRLGVQLSGNELITLTEPGQSDMRMHQ